MFQNYKRADKRKIDHFHGLSPPGEPRLSTKGEVAKAKKLSNQEVVR